MYMSVSDDPKVKIIFSLHNVKRLWGVISNNTQDTFKSPNRKCLMSYHL